jgi:hypothetical protein
VRNKADGATTAASSRGARWFASRWALVQSDVAADCTVPGLPISCSRDRRSEAPSEIYGSLSEDLAYLAPSRHIRPALVCQA